MSFFRTNTELFNKLNTLNNNLDTLTNSLDGGLNTLNTILNEYNNETYKINEPNRANTTGYNSLTGSADSNINTLTSIINKYEQINQKIENTKTKINEIIPKIQTYKQYISNKYVNSSLAKRSADIISNRNIEVPDDYKEVYEQSLKGTGGMRKNKNKKTRKNKYKYKYKK